MSVRVVMSDLFSGSYSDLDGNVKNRVLDFVVKLQERPDMPGLDVKTPTGVSDSRIKTARVNDFWRAVLIELPESSGYVLVAVKPHDDAYTFAGRLRFGVNEVTGALEVVDQASLNEAITRVETTDTAAESPAPILKGLRARDLRPFGIDEEVAERLVAITDENQLLTVAEELPGLQANAVLDLAAGHDADTVWTNLVAEQERDIDTSDVMRALDRPLSRLTFTDGRDAEELRAVLEGSFKAWRVWLHPLQRKLAYHDGWRGPYRVTGGAGTGKTVTAIHRARHLAKRLEQQGDDSKVLFTTFTKNLAQNIESQLKELAGPDILKRVDVLNIDALAQRILTTGKDSGARPRPRGDSDSPITEAWNTARAHAAEHWDIDFLQAEWSEVVLAQGIEKRSTYLRASRSGRGKRVSRPQRADLWSVFERFTQLLTAQELMTFTQVAAQAASVAGQLALGGDDIHDSSSRRLELPRYRHAIIDEAQDLHPAHWRLVRALIPDGNDDLFIVGDAHQRIYGKQVVLSRLGIETRGRSRRLTVNYRTSRQILNWSLRVAYGQSVDDLDGQGESLAGARSEFDGPEPEPCGFDSSADEKSALLDKLRAWSEADIPWSQMAVVARTRSLVGELSEAVSDSGIPVATVEAGTDENTLGEQVRVMTMHRAKGLEYRAVALVGVGSKELPPRTVRQLEGEESEAARARERNLLYVCGSRAREQLYVSWVGEPSELISGV
ncbi:UvrD-like helicase family protein [Halopolyspora algeriensis]|uniref:DNA 3'-5' helicase n=1 Tax=Halopolyspora algeriensis TaxID=1500506 RepID=A0A368VUW4_9ACTN|nr:UvrD-helicase domain-containing protein [Halopolyspora algeriensis]RCW45886.1 UvrD-like helicase family protein [Halopolyspora algeriensis]TQM55300.1 UvrD-like helicase family protein [Halopolyspora algeriensis]